MVILLLGTGVYLTIRTGFVQVTRLGHGFGVTSGRYDDPDDPGDVSHFQALTTALSATVGIGNIAGVAMAIHFGGPGALFWMWVTAFLGMATKYSEVTLAQRYRIEDERGTVAGGPMYYIEKGLGPKWKPMAVFFALMLAFTAFLTGNAVQANTVADQLGTAFGVPLWVTGAITAGVVAAVILGGIKRIGRVTAVLIPIMAAIYLAGALLIILMNIGEVPGAFRTIFTEAFNPQAGIAGVGAGVFIVTLMWGVRRGLFSNEAGQGSAPIAHAAAKTEEPVSEGVVALLEPFIDTIVICSFTGLVIILMGTYSERFPTEITLAGGDITYTAQIEENRYEGVGTPEAIVIFDGAHVENGVGAPLVSWHEAPVNRLYVDEDQIQSFTGTVFPALGTAVSASGETLSSLYGDAVENAAPLTAAAFRKGLAPLGDWGHLIVVFGVLLFGISTAISWSYYGDRCAHYLFGQRALLPYKVFYLAAHFLGAVLPLAVVWALGDVLLAIVIWPNLIALILLAPTVVEETRSYFERKPWVAVAAKRAGGG
ncbi:MAG TPA: sodium:alanine symporter family protein [Gemmatimonadetes bacterium]|nr:sodium:alanine symporter family protein [Gemmatimonadota bacterium]HIB10052.1 sodium:alanine symporter family protein [Gemmatimonadota bacterium]HIC15912.1 sodium:alanine symporter family protein [Gemmatimonadota bacterium]HIN78502.1 sodium:alanine symporter family protein [Gemmatimonadota bacterium]